jgi:hypothetical protein
VTVVGSEGNDVFEVRQQGASLIVTLDSADGRFSQTMRTASVSKVVFAGLEGNDSFMNLSRVTSAADGGPGDDVLQGGRAADSLVGGDGNDQLLGGAGFDLLDGGAGNDAAWGGGGNDRLVGGGGQDQLYGEFGRDELWGGAEGDMLDGGVGNDAVRGEKGDDMLLGSAGADLLVGGEGLDREADAQDRFQDGDVDGDGFDDDYDYLDIFYESPGSQSAYADDAAVASTIAFVSTEVRDVLGIAADDVGLRVRVAREPFGDAVTGVWRYMTPDKIQVWGRWSHPASDRSRLQAFVQYSYTGPYTGNIADYADPANYVISEESRLYAGYLNGPFTFINWLPGAAVSFYYSAPNEQATGFPPPIEPLREALGSLPNFSNVGDSFSGDLSTEIGFQGVQPVLDLLRTIDRVGKSWYPQPRARQ